jgi:hypothetical protein
MKPRNLFRCRRRPAAHVEPLVEAIAKHRRRFKPGTLTEAVVWHDHDCRRPQGGDCTCKPEIEIRPLEDPERN